MTHQPLSTTYEIRDAWTGKTDRQRAIFNSFISLAPPMFLKGTSEEQQKEFLSQTLNMINNFPPETNFSFDDMPFTWDQLVPFGAVTVAGMMLQADYALRDLNWSAGTVNFNLDRVNKVRPFLEMSGQILTDRIKRAKRGYLMRILPRGVGTPRLVNVVGQFLKISLGQSWPSGISDSFTQAVIP